MLAFVFPGQGSQYVGMARGLLDHEAGRRTFEEADDALEQGLTKLVMDGPLEELTRTVNNQPAIFTHSVAHYRVLAEERPDLFPSMAAGHSLGEYGALVAARCLSFADGVRLLRLRGEAMQDAVPAGEGTMAALLRVDREQVLDWCERTEGVVELAAVNSPSQIVIAGEVEAVRACIELALSEGCRRAQELQVSAPFHCSMLAPAAERLRDALGEVRLDAPAIPVFQNVDAVASSDPEAIRQRLVDQVRRPVMWEDCGRAMLALGATRFLELGPGYTLCGLLKKLDRKLDVRSIDRPGALEGW